MNLMGVYLNRNYSTMKKLSIIYWLSLSFYFLPVILKSQSAFLKQRPFSSPFFEQYPASQTVDHHYPYTNQADGLFIRFDGMEFSENVIYPNCISGQSCYDGHAGIDFFMPLNTPIVAPADGYVISSNFAPSADPCPGGIAANGEQGTIILAHGNGYFTVYLHMEPPLNVSVGNSVSAGDILGFAGNTGCAINTHLHFEVRKGSWNINFDQPYAVDPFGWWKNTNDPIQDIRGNSSDWLWVSDTLVDDGDNGFQRFQGPNWLYLNTGFNGDSWTVPATQETSEIRHSAIWVPSVPTPGEYDIEVYLPELYDATTGAIYEINLKSEDGTSNKTEVVVNQSLGADGFFKISTENLSQGNNFSIILRDLVTIESENNRVVFDAIRIIPSALSTQKKKQLPDSFTGALSIDHVSPNPFNSSLAIRYRIKNNSMVEVSIFNALGKLVFRGSRENKTRGKHVFRWNGKNNKGTLVTSGVYFVHVKAGEYEVFKKAAYVE